MTIDLSNSTGKLYFQGTRASHISWYATFESKYSNTLLKFADESTQLSLSVDEYKTNWYSFDWSNSYNQTRDIAGYYVLRLYGDDTLVLSKLVKIINDAGGDQQISFISPDNENNQQVIFYK